MQGKETTFHFHGQKIAAKIWNEKSGIPTLALHGWLDNAASFDKLAPLLPNLHIVAIDLPGHGHSDHKPKGSFIHIFDFVVSAIQVVNHLEWDTFCLLGHSLGAAIACIIAGALPRRIQQIMLIDGLGPYTTPSEQAPQQLGLFLHELTEKPNKTPPNYTSPEKAIQKRLKVNPMQLESMKLLVDRGLKQIDNGEWTWRTDPMLLVPSAIELTEDQLLAFLKSIVSPTCIIRPEPGFPFPPGIVKRRLAALAAVEIFQILGQHHVHLDDPITVASCINSFLEKNPS